MNVREIMTKDPIVGHMGTTIYDAARTLEAEEIRHLPIVEDGEVRGIVSDRDLARFSHLSLVGDGAPIAARLQAPVSTIMTADPASVDPDDDVDAAIDLMLENRCGAVPVVNGDDGRLVGIVSYVDVLRAARGQIG